MPLEPGRRLGPYEVVERLGSGGMGEVYRAHDARLGRDVAVKVLNPQLADDPDALERFEREARAIAALSHPNILAVFDVGKDAGVSYVVTELLEGETLGARLQRGALPVRDALDSATQMARGLAAAHDKGLVHRDLKPENVFLTRAGQIKLLDFGLAKARAAVPVGDAATVTRHTQAGLVVGTVGYMSPEQARGREADPRSDIFSFGAVLYEMVTGCRAFSGPSPADTISALLSADPPRVSSTSHSVTALGEVAHRCLAKNARDRYPSARELLDALDALARIEWGPVHPSRETGPTTSVSTPARSLTVAEEAPSVAVLPFADMSPTRDQDYFCEGMAEEIMSALGQIQGLRVAARTSAFQFKGKTQDIRQIGDALGVTKVLEGSVRTAGTRLRVTAQLINVADGYRLWSERYDREMVDVFEIQDEIAGSVVNALKLRLVEPDLPAGGQKHTRDLEAYQLYLKGRQHRYKQQFREALKLYEQAVERDPGYAVARAAIAEVCILLANYGFMRPKIAFARCEEELEHAVALAGESADVKCVESWYRAAYAWDLEGALAAGQRAIELDAHHVVAHAFYGLELGFAGRYAESITAARKCIELDPLSPYGFGMTAVALVIARRFDECIAVAHDGLALDPAYLLCIWPMAYACMGRRDEAEAIRHFERALSVGGRSSSVLGPYAAALARAGRTDEARAILSELEERSKREYVAPIHLTRPLACLGDRERAIEKFEQSAAQRDPLALFYRMPGLEDLAGEERFEAVLRRMGLRGA